MNTLEDKLADRIIDTIVDFRVRYGYERKLDDVELHTKLVTLLQAYAEMVSFSKAITHLQRVAGTSAQELAEIQEGLESLGGKDE